MWPRAKGSDSVGENVFLNPLKKNQGLSKVESLESRLQWAVNAWVSLEFWWGG